MKKRQVRRMKQERESQEFCSNHTKWCGILIAKEECSRTPFHLVILKNPGIFPKLFALNLFHPETCGLYVSPELSRDFP